MNKTKIIVGALTLGICIVLAGVFYRQHELTTLPTPSASRDPAAENIRYRHAYQEKLKNEARVVTQHWPMYTSTKLGVSLRYVHGISDNGRFGSTVIFEAGNILFITATTSDLYLHRGQLPATNDQVMLRKLGAFEPGWAIWVQDVNSDADLNRMITTKYGDGCKLGTKTQTGQGDILSVDVIPVRAPNVNNPNDVGSCRIEERLAFLYSPQYKRAAIWDMGQDDTFILSRDQDTGGFPNDYSVDVAMADSFSFIDRQSASH